MVKNFRGSILPLLPVAMLEMGFLTVVFSVVDYFSLTEGLGFGVPALHSI